MMSDPVIEEVLERLADTELTHDQTNLVSRALFPESSASDNTNPSQQTSIPTRRRDNHRLCFLKSIRVRGFRGIGPECELSLQPNPGLTIVAGRNGSGKSSIVEGFEFALTQDSKRWHDRSVEWKTGWRNIHEPMLPEIHAEISLTGQTEFHVISATWEEDDLERVAIRVSTHNGPPRGIGTLGWQDAVKTYRPILSYAESAQIVERGPAERYEAIAPILGMQSLQSPLEQLKDLRLSADKLSKNGKRVVKDLENEFERSTDERAQRTREALTGEWDIEAVEDIVTGMDEATSQHDALFQELEQLGLPDATRVIEVSEAIETAVARVAELEGSDAAKAQNLADLLASAISLYKARGDIDCPVCGQEAGFRSERISEMEGEVERLRLEAAELQEAKKALRDSRREVDGITRSRPDVLNRASEELPEIDFSEVELAWASWSELPDRVADISAYLLSGYVIVESSTSRIRANVQEIRILRESAWRLIVLKSSESLPLIRKAQQAIESLPKIRKAEQWLKECGETIRDRRFKVIDEEVKSIWNRIAEGLNVMLEEIVLARVRGEGKAQVEPSSFFGIRAAGLGGFMLVGDRGLRSWRSW